MKRLVLLVIGAATILVACTPTSHTERSLYAPLALELQVDYPERSCAQKGESVSIRFTVHNQGSQPFLVQSKEKPVLDFVVQESGQEVFSWAAVHPDSVLHEIEWKPDESQVIEGLWIVPDKPYAPGQTANITGILSDDSKGRGQVVPITLCLGMPFEARPG